MILKNIQSIKTKLADRLSKTHQIPPGHIASLDVVRFIAACFIIIGHIKPFYVSVDYTGNVFVAAFAYIFVHVRRLGIMFFLLSSGFLFGRSLQKGKPLLPRYLKAVKRLTVIFLVWNVFYALVPTKNPAELPDDIATYGILKSYPWHVAKIPDQPLLLLLSGTKYHLWFIPALMISISVLVLFMSFKKERYLPLVAIFLYLLSILLFQIPKPLVEGYAYYKYFRAYCSGIAIVIFGWWLSRQTNFSMKDALKLFLVAIVVQVLQDLALWNFYHLKPNQFNSIGLVPAIFGIFFMIVCHPDFGQNTLIARWGKMTLGIYILHPFFLDLLQELNKKVMLNIKFCDLAFPAVIAIACVFSIKLLSKNPLLKQIIS